jgi:hypothetical protein
VRSTQLTVSQLTGEPVYNRALSATAVCDVLMTNLVSSFGFAFRAKSEDTVVRVESGPCAVRRVLTARGRAATFEADRAGRPARTRRSRATRVRTSSQNKQIRD